MALAPNSDNPSGNLSRRGTAVLLVKIAGAASSFLMYVVLARTLGVSDYGVFIYALTWLNVMLLVGKFGVDLMVIRFLPAYIENGDWPRARGVLRFGHIVVGVITGGLVLFGLLSIYVGPLSEEGFGGAFAIGLFSIPLLGFSAVRQGALRAVRAFVLAEIPDGLIRPWLLIAAVGVTWMLAAPLNAGDGMLCYLGVNVAVFAVGTWWYLRVIPAPLSAIAPTTEARTWFWVSLQLMVHTGLFQLVNQVDVLLLGLLADVQDVARYSAASRMASFISFGPIAMSSIAAPLVSARFAAQDLAGLQQVVLSGTRMGFAFAAGVSLVFGIFGSPILALFGPEFTSAYPALLVLVLGQLVNAFWGLGSYVMIMTGRQGHLVLIVVVALCLNAVLNWVFIPVWGFMGAATATAITTAAWSGAVFFYCRTTLRVRVSAL
jgi:O-antigen/teichoic acid export membrane protein